MRQRAIYRAMLRQTEIEELKTQILRKLQEALPTMHIEDVYLRPDEGWDGDPLLHVYIGYSGTRPEGVIPRSVAIDKILELLSDKPNMEEYPITTWLKTENFQKEWQNTDWENHEGGFYNLA